MYLVHLSLQPRPQQALALGVAVCLVEGEVVEKGVAVSLVDLEESQTLKMSTRMCLEAPHSGQLHHKVLVSDQFVVVNG